MRAEYGLPMRWLRDASQLARTYGVSHKSISFVRDGVNWGWVDAA